MDFQREISKPLFAKIRTYGRIHFQIAPTSLLRHDSLLGHLLANVFSHPFLPFFLSVSLLFFLEIVCTIHIICTLHKHGTATAHSGIGGS